MNVDPSEFAAITDKVDVLEPRVTALSQALCLMGEAAGMPAVGAELRPPRPRHLRLVKTEPGR